MVRLLLALPVALGLSLGVLLLMANLVNPTTDKIDPVSVQSVDFVVAEQENNVSRRTRVVPEPPETITEPISSLSTPSNADINMNIDSLGLTLANAEFDINIGAVSVNTLSLGEVPFSHQVTPIYRVDPHYPAKAKQRRAEGYVIVRFDIDEQGIPRDLQIIEAKPKRIFEREALKALRQWRYQARIEQGIATPQVGQTVKLEFKYPK